MSAADTLRVKSVWRAALTASTALVVAALVTACGSDDVIPERTARADPRCQRHAHNSHHAAECGYAQVPSIDRRRRAPERVHPRGREVRRVLPSCQQVTEMVVYAASDWYRLAQRLAADEFPCATYQISIPPTQAADGTWTQPRRGEAKRIRVLGAGFAALAEIRVNAWSPWLAAHPGKTWYDAGREARKRMVGAGYGVRRGETWAINEFMLPVLTDPVARREMRDFARGLYEAAPRSQGLVFDVVPFQNAPDIPEYKSQLKLWLLDRPFWRDMNRYVRVWADEVYVDAQSCCVAGAPPALRAARLNAYLQHPLTLAQAGPAEAATARRFLTDAYLPLGNAAWAWDYGFGNTLVAGRQMQRLISDQVYAMRLFSARRSSREAQSRIGFAWAPRDPSGRIDQRFVRATEHLLDRLASAMRGSGTSASPEGACGPLGVLCDCSVPGAEFVGLWASFSSWN